MQNLATSFEWMAWTGPTAIFLLAIVLMLAVMTVFGIRYPAVERKGFLPLATTRGGRLYIGLLGVAVINLAWLGATDLTLWWGTAVSFVWLIVVLRWG